GGGGVEARDIGAVLRAEGAVDPADQLDLVVVDRILAGAEPGRRRCAELRALLQAERGHPAPAGQEGRREQYWRRLPEAGAGPRRVGRARGRIRSIAGPEQEHGDRGVLASLDAG